MGQQHPTLQSLRFGPSETESLKTKRVEGGILAPKAGGYGTQREPVTQFKPSGWGKAKVPVKYRQENSFILQEKISFCVAFRSSTD